MQDAAPPSPARRSIPDVLGGVLESSLPAGTSKLARRTYVFELISTLFFTLSLAAIEGGVVAVFARQTFDQVVPGRHLNLCVALLGAMGELANILSFVWSGLSFRKRLVPFINALQVAVIAIIGLISLLPESPTGLYLLVGVVLGARFFWSGILTVRTGIWRANYPPGMRAVIVGRFSAVQVFVVGAAGAGLGWLLDHEASLFRVVLPIACVCSLGAVWAFGKIRIRHEWKLLRPSSHGPGIMKPWQGPLVVWRVLSSDRRYAQFMLCMFVLGFGNLMVNPILAITLKEEFGFRYLKSILITSSIQAVVQVLAIPFWARFLDRAHVVRFRSIHSWVFVAGSGTFMMGAITHDVAFMFAGAAVQGIAYAGGALAWNLGHVDFSPPSETSLYMATHVTLNGVRGLLAPLVAVTCYEMLKAAGWSASVWMFVAAFIVNAAGAVGFVWLRMAMGAEARSSRR